MRHQGLGRLAAVLAAIAPSVLQHSMNDSNSSSNPAPPRATLKLKGAARKPSDENKSPPNPRPPGKANPKPGAHWSDEYKRRMQEDMDDLLR